MHTMDYWTLVEKIDCIIFFYSQLMTIFVDKSYSSQQVSNLIVGHSGGNGKREKTYLLDLQGI